MSPRIATAACAPATALGVLVSLWLALPALGDGRTLVGVLVAVGAGLAVVLGAAGLVVVLRAGSRRP